MGAKDVAIVMFVIILWSFNFIASKVAIEHFPVFFLLFLRLTITSVVLLPFLRKISIPWKLLLGISFTWATLHISFLFKALDMGLDVSIAIMIDQLRVPFAVLLGVMIFKDKLSVNAILGIMLALIGTLMIVKTPQIRDNYLAFAFMLASSLAWALYNIQLKFTGDVKVLNFLGWISLIGLLQVTPLTFFTESNHWEILRTATLSEYLAIIYSGAINTIIGNGLWYYLLKRHPVKQVVPYSLLVPLIGTLAAVFWLGETMNWYIAIGGAFTVVGVGIIIERKKPASHSTIEESEQTSVS